MQNELTEAEWSLREQLKHMFQNKTVNPYAQEDGIPNIDALPNKSCERLYARLRHQTSIRAQINFSLTNVITILRSLRNLSSHGKSIEEQLKKVQFSVDELKNQARQLLDYKQVVVHVTENYSVLTIEELLAKLQEAFFSSKRLHADWCSIESIVEQTQVMIGILILKERELLTAQIDNNETCTPNFNI